MMLSSNDTLLNPDIYLNHLSPPNVVAYEAGRNALLVLLGATIWDMFATLPDDIRVVRRSRVRFTTFCFIFSRAFATVYVASNVIRRTTPIHHLYALTLSGTINAGMSITCSSYLFLQRIFAVYADSPRVRRFFAFLWMAYVCSESLLVISVKPTYIPQTLYFQHSGANPLMGLTMAMMIVYDSSVFFAISYKIGIAHVVIDREMGWKRFILGKALPRLSQAILRGGQQYYLIAFLAMTSIAILLCFSSLSPIIKSMLTVWVTPLVASMSCRVHRNIKLFEYDVSTPYPISEIRFL